MKSVFDRIAEEVMTELLKAEPIRATGLGDHSHDGLLPDYSASAREQLARTLDDHLAALDALDDLELESEDQVDLEILRAAILRAIFEIREVRSTTWNPMVWNPGTGLHALMSREFAPLEQRLEAARSRMAAIPHFLASARRELGEMPRVHVETAIGQFQGTLHLVNTTLAEHLGAGDEAIAAAGAALEEFVSWLSSQLPLAHRDPSLGERLYSAVLWHSLDDDTQAGELLAQANSHLLQIENDLRVVAGQYLDEDAGAAEVVARALADVAARFPVTNRTVLEQVSHSLDRSLDFLREVPLIDLPVTAVQVIEMPEIHRGVAVAYCDSPGPLEPFELPTFVAVSPTPEGWEAERIDSFYREYNGVQLHDLTIHEAFPGHVLQLAHSRIAERTRRVRAFGRSSVLIEGWAVYAEELMVNSGYLPADDAKAALALRLQQLKMQARMTINAILDVRVHTHDITEQEALDLMMNRGFQEEGEAVGKWRRALLTAGQLPTYFVGYLAVRAIAQDLHVLHPDWSDQEVHNLMLSHGSPAPRHLRSLLGI
ncbi:MAG: DUF885 domain-containing protein [Candidatus Nanopelagicales bacterium]